MIRTMTIPSPRRSGPSGRRKIKRDEDWANAQFKEIDGDGTGSITQEEYRTARQQMLDDQLTTGSTKSQGEAGAEGTASTSETASDSGDGIPVYIYRFGTM
ncbi:hypothetical protein QW131_28640 [Roseibium salinum]|nr:hypothetical protein [Roseibium salinum]